MMKKKILELIPIFSVVITFVTLFLLLAETFIYPGIVRKHLIFDCSYFAIIASVLSYYSCVYFSKNLPSKYVEKVVAILLLIFIPFTIYFSFLERITYPNYVFSYYHIDPHEAQILSLFIILQLAFYKISKEHNLTIIKNFQSKIILVFSIVFSIFLLGNNLQARWSIIDDHEIVNMLGSDKTMSLKEIPKLISQTEISNWSRSLRYRPSYYTLRVIEAYLWKGTPQLWYAARIGFLAVFLFVLVTLVSKETSLLMEFGFSLFVMAGHYWSDIWARLGPSEIYAVLGLSLYAFGLYKILKTASIKDSSIIPWLGIFIGGFIATGSKENFVILALPSLFLMVKYLLKKQINLRLIFPLLHIIFSLFIATGIILAIKRSGQDIYANEITLGNRCTLLVSGLVKTIKDFKIAEILTGFIILYFWQIKRMHIKKIIHQSINTIYLLVFLIFTYLFQIIYYSGNWPTNTRYDFPGILSKQLFWLACLILFLGLVKMIKKRSITKMCNGITISLAIMLIFTSFNGGFEDLIKAVRDNASATSLFTSKINELSEEAFSYPNMPVIFRSRDFRDYESVYSLVRFFEYLNIKNQVYLDYEDEKINSRSGLEKSLSENLKELSKTGLSGNQSFFEPFSKMNVATQCIDVYLSYPSTDAGCSIGIRLN